MKGANGFYVDKLVFIVHLLDLVSSYRDNLPRQNVTATIFKLAHNVTVRKPGAPNILRILAN